MIDIGSKQMQRWLAVALLVAAILLVSLAVIVPLANKGLELLDAKNNLVFRIQQYERILARKDAVIASMVAIKEQYQKRGLLNRQSTGALASAEVQEFIKKVITEAGGQLSSTQALPLSTKNEFSRITVSVRMTGNSEVLRAVLYKLETSTPLLIINQIEIRPMRGVRSRTTRQIEPSNELNINFQAVSFMRRLPE
ncbi:MAG: type II secretion system protein GspM [Methylobacter tundripaludum]|uniref:General secretion pathway protein M n=1 Tax=Methylobacter tundripaludum TaxID=173365 RepID=A0A2S6H4U4_9GAMM|nr:MULTISPECIES: type II secretion system protein GspM [Methylobacter]MDD4904581.1 type II secretion system protein GspM [Methylobacter tundripaludum]MDI1276669.1 type II secretion system protein GspM [Methylobacter sp.]MDI1357338.1 type II secretion system protein GspM [Methylobacter sp.]PPK72508.1 general secretion pathway protein M [Methylobacter tundripaludum]